MQASALAGEIARSKEAGRKHSASYLVFALPFLPVLLAIFLFIRYSPTSMVITSASMRPELIPGDLVISTRVYPWEVEEGDVLAFRKVVPFTRAQLVVHRVVEIGGNGDIYTFKTKGDANEAIDSWDVTSGEVVGRVAVVLPQVGKYLSFFQRNVTALVLLMLGIALPLLYGYTLVMSQPAPSDPNRAREPDAARAQAAGNNKTSA
ncbi:MAG: signal peptidase I [Chloroflexi bacterium]|nr:signal peptidase I [Chloroflexota bacterium]